MRILISGAVSHGYAFNARGLLSERFADRKLVSKKVLRASELLSFFTGKDASGSGWTKILLFVYCRAVMKG